VGAAGPLRRPRGRRAPAALVCGRPRRVSARRGPGFSPGRGASNRVCCAVTAAPSTLRHGSVGLRVVRKFGLWSGLAAPMKTMSVWPEAGLSSSLEESGPRSHSLRSVRLPSRCDSLWVSPARVPRRILGCTWVARRHSRFGVRVGASHWVFVAAFGRVTGARGSNHRCQPSGAALESWWRSSERSLRWSETEHLRVKRTGTVESLGVFTGTSSGPSGL